MYTIQIERVAARFTGAVWYAARIWQGSSLEHSIATLFSTRGDAIRFAASQLPAGANYSVR